MQVVFLGEGCGNSSRKIGVGDINQLRLVVIASRFGFVLAQNPPFRICDIRRRLALLPADSWKKGQYKMSISYRLD